MPFKAICSCRRHQEWHHSESVDLRVASFYEEKYCDADCKHGGRKRKICLACRGRIQLEEKYRKLENSSVHVDPPNSRSGEETSHVTPEFDMEESNFIPDDNSNSHSLTEPKDCAVTNNGSIDVASATAPRVSRGIQFPTLPLRPYQDAQERTQRSMRGEIVETLKNTALKYVHNETGRHLEELMVDVVKSKQWQQVFGGSVYSEEKNSEDSHFLNALAEEYKSCKDKQTAKLIKNNARQQKEKFLIGNSKAQSRLTLPGKMLDNVGSRTEAATKIGRVCHYGDEKRRLLSIVARDFSYLTLQKVFGCSPNTITAARVHCLLFGRGGVPPPQLKFSRQRVSPLIIEELTEFLHRDNVTRASSCRSVMVDGEETAVRYWQDSVKNIVQQYCLEFPNGVKRTYVYTHLPRNFRMNSMLAGLCNLCDEFGHSNFDALCILAKEVTNLQGSTLNYASVEKILRGYQTFLKRKFSKSAERHSSCKELCMSYALGSCPEEHSEHCIDITAFYEVCETLTSSMTQCSDHVQRLKLEEKLADAVGTHWEYLGHLLRTKHQADYYQYVLKCLKPGECVVVIDYKMKLELGKTTRERQRDWYGKRGISLHGFYIVAQVSEGERSAEVVDLWSEDTKQDTWFTQSALDICFSWLEKSFTGFRVYLFSDNGPHYHNTGFLLYLAEVNDVFNLSLLEYNYFEAGEGKTVLDTHFAHISHKIVRWVRVGNNLQSGEQLGELIGSIKNTSCFQLLIDRQKAPKNVGTLKDISLFGSFAFPVEGEMAGGIICRSLTGFGKNVSKTKTQLQTLSGRRTPIAGATGASIKEDTSAQPREGIPTESPGGDTYSVHFIQHSPEPLEPVNKCPLAEYPHKERQPKEGFALKKGGGKRVLFSLAQKEIMVEFYDRQATQGIRANPKDAAEEMRRRGIEPLKETQIRSWWSTYHQKRKAALNALNEEANTLAQIPHATTGQARSPPVPCQQHRPSSQGSAVVDTPSSSATSTAPTAPQSVTSAVTVNPATSTTPTATQSVASAVTVNPATSTTPTAPQSVASAVTVNPATSTTPTAPQSLASTVTVNPATSTSPTAPQSVASTVTVNPATYTTPTAPKTVAPTMPDSVQGICFTAGTSSAPIAVTYLDGICSSITPSIIEWHFPLNFSQSTILDRCGSNACTFIALYFGHLYFSSRLQPPTNGYRLNEDWKMSLREAILKGNEIHDDIFENNAVDVAVDDAVEIAGDECGVNCIENQYDIMGNDCSDQLSDVFQQVAEKQGCHVVVSAGRSMLLVVNADKSTMIVDSHSHNVTGAMMAYAPPGFASVLASWFSKMTLNTWKAPLGATSVVTVNYISQA